MEAKILKSVQDIPLDAVHYANGRNTLLGWLKQFEKSFGTQDSVPLTNDLIHVNAAYLPRWTRELRRLEKEGFIEIDRNTEVDWNSYRLAHLRDDSEIARIDRRLKRLHRVGLIKLTLIPRAAAKEAETEAGLPGKSSGASGDVKVPARQRAE